MRLIDAEVLASDLMERWNTADEQAEKEIVAVLANVVTPILVGQPTVDAVEVVRCKYCKHYDPDTGIRCLGECEIYDGFLVAEYGFCHHGERKDGEQE